MSLLIDGHNLIGYLPNISLADPDDEAQLVMRLRRYRAHTRQPIVVVFDKGAVTGSAPGLSGNGIKVIFARAGRSADALIIERLRKSKNPRDWTVVTGDRALAASARSLGARVTTPAEFAPRLSGPPRARRGQRRPQDDAEALEKPTQVDDVDEWLKLFEATRLVSKRGKRQQK